MKVTAVSMRVVDRERVKAFASITIDDEFVVHDLRIVQGEKGLFVAMPSRRLPNGEFRDVAHPIKSEVREMIQKAVLEEYERQKEAGPSVAEPTEEAPPSEEEVPGGEEPSEEAPVGEEPEEVAEEKAREEITEDPGEKESRE
jgi:stage V sporulation protein G